MYLSAKEIEALEAVRRVHFLNPSAVRENKSLGDAVGLKSLGVHLIRVEPGHRSTEYHAHRAEEECIYVLSGRGRAVIGDQEYRIGPGDFMGFPVNGVAHEMINDGPDPLCALVIGQRLPQDSTDYPRQGKRLYRERGEWTLVDHANLKPVQR